MSWNRENRERERGKEGNVLKSFFFCSCPFCRATILALVMQALSIYFTYGLQCYMPIIILLDQYIMPGDDVNQPRGKIYLFWNVMIRLIVTFITCTYIF